MNEYKLYDTTFIGSQSRPTNAAALSATDPTLANTVDKENVKVEQPRDPTRARRHSSMDGDDMPQQDGQNHLRRQSMPMQMPMMDFGPQNTANSLNQFQFDPSLNQTMDTNMMNQYAHAMHHMQQTQQLQKQNASASSLSIDTSQYQNLMDFNTLSNSAAYPSPFDPDLNSAYSNPMSAMPLDMNMMSDDINVINDLFSAQQFGSPTFASPMAGTFNPAMYSPHHQPHLQAQLHSRPQQQESNVSNSGIAEPPSLTPMHSNASNTSDFSTMPSTRSDGHYHQQGSQSTQSNTQNQQNNSTTSMPNTSSRASTMKSRTQSHNATIGGISLPWSNPTDGWPSTMTGAKPHMETQYRDAYAPSGFDLMTTLVRVHTRKNPQISIGMVDLSCAFVVCDAQSHDNPIVYCSESFERLTGYTRFEITGQNCRFLQSPDGKVEIGKPRKYCDDDSVLYLKTSIKQATEAQISLINYRKGGQPFMNLLTMIPVFDDAGKLTQFVGFQVDLVENPHAVSSRNADGSYQVSYQRNANLPAYQLQAPDNNGLVDHGHSIPRDEVSTLLATLGSGENELSKRMIDKMILENADDVIHVLSLKGLFLYLSPSCSRVLEYEPPELVGTALSSICHPSDIVPVTRELKETQSGTSVNVVYRIRRKDSGYVWFESHGCLHTEQGKGRKCIIMVGRVRPVYTLSKRIIMTAGGIGDHEMWSKMSTTGMFLYCSNHVKGLLDKHAEEMIGTNILDIMRADSGGEFNRSLGIVLTGKSASFRHEVINRRGQVLQAHTWLYPGDATEGQKPTFVIGQTRLLKYGRNPTRASKGDPTKSLTSTSNPASFAASSLGDTTPRSTLSQSQNDENFQTSQNYVVSRAGAQATPLGQQDESLASEENAFEELKTVRSSSWQYELRQLERRNRLLAEEVQHLLAAKKKRKRRRGAGMMQKDCANCHTTSTPEWRRGPSGNRDLCNSCGLRWAKQQGRVSPRNNASPRHSVSNSSSKASLSPMDRQHSNIAIDGSAIKPTTPSAATAGSGTSVVIPDKRNSPTDPSFNPQQKAQKTHRSSVVTRIEEVEEPTR